MYKFLKPKMASYMAAKTQLVNTTNKDMNVILVSKLGFFGVGSQSIRKQIFVTFSDDPVTLEFKIASERDTNTQIYVIYISN